MKASGALIAGLAATLAWSDSAAAASLTRVERDEIRAHDHALVLAAGRGAELRRAGGVRVARLLPVWRLPSGAALRLAPLAELVVADRFIPAATHFSSGDPRVPEQWWINTVGAAAVEPPGPGVPVTVIDSGIDVTHPEFAGRPSTTIFNTQQIAGPTEEHGTAVASVVAAPANGQGVVGVYPQAALQIWDASPAGPGISTSDVVAGIDAAARRGRGVINLSLGSPFRDPLLELFIAAAFRNGTLVVAAAGNERGRGSPLSFPGSYPHVLTVGALDQTGRAAAFSSGSPYVDVAAPGQGIPVAVPVTVNPTGYAYFSGTSFASPLVAGAAAWVWTARKSLHITQVFELMRSSARDVEVAGFDAFTGFGRLDIPGALTARPLAPDPQEPNEDIAFVKPGRLFLRGWPALNAPRRLRATVRARLDFAEDTHDVYRVWVSGRRTTVITVSPTADVDAALWGPGSSSVFDAGARRRRNLKALSERPGRRAETLRVTNRGRRGAYHYVEVYTGSARIRRVGAVSYRLSVSTAPVRAARR